jgi:hypothetical protein
MLDAVLEAQRLRALAALILMFLPGCASALESRGWIILADEHRDSRCQMVSADEAKTILQRGGYRILLNHVTGHAYVYSVEPLTDLRRCREAVNQWPRHIEGRP